MREGDKRREKRRERDRGGGEEGEREMACMIENERKIETL